jgi:peptidoglycan/LPS O-acetylase OafA/YrhL
MSRLASAPSGQYGKDRLLTIEALRGLAALAVAWFHFTNANPAFPETGWLRLSGAWGWLGVESFFVISGFVLPLAMYRGGYRIRHAGRFLARRLIRLHPAYLVSLAVTVALWYVSSPAGATPPGATQILLHAFYLPALFGQPWLNTVYWTLGIEVQFYVFLACSFPLLSHPAAFVRVASLATMAGLSWLVTPEIFIFRYLVIFAMGSVAFLIVVDLFDRATGLVVLLLLAASAGALHGWPAAIVATVTAIITLMPWQPPVSWRPMLGIGAISYSLYLIHGPLGGRIVNLGARYADGAGAELAVVMVAVVVTLGAAVVLHVLVEQPSLRLAARLKTRR